jgi:hypothetical protein
VPRLEDGHQDDAAGAVMAVEVGELAPATNVGCLVEDTDHGCFEASAAGVDGEFFGRFNGIRHAALCRWAPCRASRLPLGNQFKSASCLLVARDAVGTEDLAQCSKTRWTTGSLPTAGGNPDGLSTATVAKGANPMAPKS